MVKNLLIVVVKNLLIVASPYHVDGISLAVYAWGIYSDYNIFSYRAQFHRTCCGTTWWTSLLIG